MKLYDFHTESHVGTFKPVEILFYWYIVFIIVKQLLLTIEIFRWSDLHNVTFNLYILYLILLIIII